MLIVKTRWKANLRGGEYNDHDRKSNTKRREKTGSGKTTSGTPSNYAAR